MENDKCLYTKQLVRVEEKVGNTVHTVRYIQQEHRRLDKHKQLKQARLEQRKKRKEMDNYPIYPEDDGYDRPVNPFGNH